MAVLTFWDDVYYVLQELMQKLTWLPESKAANIKWKENYLMGSQICNFIFFREKNKQILLAVTKNLLSASTTAVKRLSLDFIYLFIFRTFSQQENSDCLENQLQKLCLLLLRLTMPESSGIFWVLIHKKGTDIHQDGCWCVMDGDGMESSPEKM